MLKLLVDESSGKIIVAVKKTCVFAELNNHVSTISISLLRPSGAEHFCYRSI
jgi:hypothetical protein